MIEMLTWLWKLLELVILKEKIILKKLQKEAFIGNINYTYFIDFITLVLEQQNFPMNSILLIFIYLKFI